MSETWSFGRSDQTKLRCLSQFSLLHRNTSHLKLFVSPIKLSHCQNIDGGLTKEEEGGGPLKEEEPRMWICGRDYHRVEFTNNHYEGALLSNMPCQKFSLSMMALIRVLYPNSKQFASDWMKDDITKKKQRFTIFELRCHHCNVIRQRSLTSWPITIILTVISPSFS